MDELEDLERTIKDGPIHEKIPSQPNENVDLTSHCSITHLIRFYGCSMMSYGEQISVLGDRMSSIDDIMIQDVRAA